VGLVELEDAETGRRVTLDTGWRLPGRNLRIGAQRRGAEVKKRLARLGVDLVPINAAESYVEPLIRFFTARAKRLR
jgi:hypothetical protein